MIKYVRSDPERYNLDPTRLHQFEMLLVQLDRQVFCANILEGCFSQDYALPDAGPSSQALIAGNRALYDQFKLQLRAYLQRLSAGLSDPIETFDRLHFVCASFFSLSFLFPFFYFSFILSSLFLNDWLFVRSVAGGSVRALRAVPSTFPVHIEARQIVFQDAVGSPKEVRHFLLLGN